MLVGERSAAAGIRPLTAQSLITSAKAEELSARLSRLQRRVRPLEYAEWLKSKGFVAYERDASVEEKLVFLEEYLNQSSTQGHAIDVAAACLLPWKHTTVAYGISTLNGLVGLTLGWSYQFRSRLALGVYFSNSYGHGVFDDTFDNTRQEFVGIATCGGPTITFGDKVEGAALLLSVGFGGVFGGSESTIPLKAGVYFRNFYAGYIAYVGDMGARMGLVHHQVEVGYSIFLGQRKSWPPRP